MITVLMPVYNAAPYLREAIESVLAQDHKDFEFLIIDDGSTDDSPGILSSYKDDRIRIYTQSNTGVIGALNKGLELASGDYIARFDADDVCYPYRLSLQYDYMQQHPTCVLMGGASDYIDKDGEFLFEWQPSAYTTDNIRQNILIECPLDHPTVIFKKEVALQIGGYPKGALHFEDHLFWMQFLKYGEVANTNTPLIKHRFNPESVTIDEKWRGQRFNELKYEAIKNGFITDANARELAELAKKQDLKKYKEAAYYSMIAKKYLWNRYDPYKARKNIIKAIKLMPFAKEPYLLYFLSFLPEKILSSIYKKVKAHNN